MRKLFSDDPGRGERMVTEAAGIYFDYSKNLITSETLALLLRLAEESDLRARIDAMFGGEARTWFPASTRCWKRWRALPTGCAAGSGKATPESRSAPSST
jgi:hypothetical protein